MTSQTIKLGDVSLDTRDYASQGSAILGIRDSGKSYTATMLAERLMDAGIPIIAFDPIGLWRWLRVGAKGKGYPVVVAGGEGGDLPLTPQSAPEIVRAAMRQGVSLVLDLYSMELSKEDWRRIVASCIRVLLYENKGYGLRHVFIEEAAEFAPQIVPKDGAAGKVYAEIEKLARMGGNALLGYTLINQRAEQINKAVLELCDNMLLHRQKGKNSLNSLGKWLDLGTEKGGKAIVNSLPTLPQGSCWVWAAGSDKAVLVKMPAKKTFHPDRRAMRDQTAPSAAQAVNVSAFVEQMSATLETFVEQAKADDPKALRAEIARLTKLQGAAAVDPAEIERADKRGYDRGFTEGCKFVAREARTKHTEWLDRISKDSNELVAAFQKLSGNVPAPSGDHKAPPSAPSKSLAAPRKQPSAPAPSDVPDGLSGPQRRILNALATWSDMGQEGPSNAQVAWLAGYSPSSSSYANPRGALRAAGLIEYPSPDRLTLTGEGRARAMATDLSGSMLEHVLSLLTGPEARILSAIAESYPEAVSNQEAAAGAGYSASSSSYANPRGSLKSKDLITYPESGKVKAADWLFP